MIRSNDLASALRDAVRLDALIAREGVVAVCEAAREERVAPLLAWLRPDLSDLAADRRMAVLEETLQRREEGRILEALFSRGIPTVIMKGAAIAHTHYPEPWCRPRLDLDVLVRVDDRTRVFETLMSLGYARPGRLPGEFANHQDVFERVLSPGLTHSVDVHWEAINRVFFVQRLPARDLLARAVPAPWTSGLASQLDPVDTLLLASIHRVAHHSDRTYLIWWQDIWLLARGLRPADETAYVDRALSLGIAGLCAHDLAEARKLFGGDEGALGSRVIARLSGGTSDRRALRFLTPGRSLLGDLVQDLAALPQWRARGRLIAEHLFPPRAFMLSTYGTTPSFLLPWLYIRRILTGSFRWLRQAAHV